MSEPIAQQLPLPAEYGAPSTVLAWPPIEQRLAGAKRYWLSTTRPDGRPHAVPIDGLWVDGRLYFGGSPKTVTQRNLAQNPAVVLHLEDADAAVIVEGEGEVTVPDEALVQRLLAASKAKYGYAPPADAYRAGVWTLAPARVLAWTSLPVDATRFTFPAPNGADRPPT